MNIGTRITGGEVTAEAGIDTTVITTVAEVAAAVLVLGETMEETDMMTRGVEGVDLMEVFPLHVVVGVPEGAPLHVGHLRQLVETLKGAITKNDLLLLRVFLPVVGVPILKAGLLVQMLMIKRCCMNHGELQLVFCHRCVNCSLHAVWNSNF